MAVIQICLSFRVLEKLRASAFGAFVENEFTPVCTRPYCTTPRRLTRPDVVQNELRDVSETHVHLDIIRAEV